MTDTTTPTDRAAGNPPARGLRAELVSAVLDERRRANFIETLTDALEAVADVGDPWVDVDRAALAAVAATALLRVIFDLTDPAQ